MKQASAKVKVEVEAELGKILLATFLPETTKLDQVKTIGIHYG